MLSKCSYKDDSGQDRHVFSVSESHLLPTGGQGGTTIASILARGNLEENHPAGGARSQGNQNREGMKCEDTGRVTGEPRTQL